MKIVAVRDDGALLVSDGLAAAVVSDDGEWITSQDSASARGTWREPTDHEVQPAMAQRLAAPLAAMHRQLQAATQVPTPPGTSTRAAGHDTTPGHDELHHYWVYGKGLAKWAASPKPWTTLVALLTPHVGPGKAKVYASRWFIEHFGFAAGSDLNRVTHGKPPRGHKVGPG